MKKAISYLAFALVCTLLLVGCATKPEVKEDEKIVLPSARIGTNGVMKVSLERSYTLKEAFEEAEVVAHIRIGNWLSEDDELISSYFDARVIELYKGNISENFVLKQGGSSKTTISGTALYKHGLELVVFLNECISSSEYSEPHENCYWLIGSWTTNLDVVKTDSGEEYLVDMLGVLSEGISPSIKNYAKGSSAFKEKILHGMIAIDPQVRAEMPVSAIRYVYAKSDVVSYFRSLKTN